jgi:L-galactono-1,4-lactone dehydrogenase
MWIPYTDAVVVVQCNDTRLAQPISPGWLAKVYSPEERLEPFLELLKGADGEVAEGASGRTPMELRGELLQLDPLNTEWVKRVNAAEAEHWRRSRGFRIDWSDQILGFDCGGQQWVLEVSFPTGGTIKEPGNKVRCSILHNTHAVTSEYRVVLHHVFVATIS